jgi:hypothetical protein
MEDVGIFYVHLVYFTATGKFWGQLENFVDIWYILWAFGIFYGHLVYFMDIWYIFSRFGMFYQLKSGNPVRRPFPRIKVFRDAFLDAAYNDAE